MVASQGWNSVAVVTLAMCCVAASPVPGAGSPDPEVEAAEAEEPEAEAEGPELEAPEADQVEALGLDTRVPNGAPAPRALPMRWAVDAPLLSVGVVGSVVQFALLPRTAPQTCRWCDTSLNGFDSATVRPLLWRSPKAAARTSDVVVYGLIPVSMISLSALGWVQARKPDFWWQDLLIMAEAVSISTAVNLAVKVGAARARPFTRLPGLDTPFSGGRDRNMSFYSGHASLGFSFVTAAGTTASLRRYKIAPVIWGVGVPAASFAAYLRTAASKHYLSDVLVASLVSGGIGFAVPFLAHRPLGKSQLQLSHFPGGARLSVRW